MNKKKIGLGYLDERWKDIIGFEDYQISDYGRVKSKERTIVDKNGVEKFLTQRILTRSYNSDGFPVVNLRREGNNHTSYVARLVGFHFLGLKKGEEIYFKDGNPKNLYYKNIGIRSVLERNRSKKTIAKGNKNNIPLWLVVHKKTKQHRIAYTSKELSDFMGISIDRAYRIFVEGDIYNTEDYLVTRINTVDFEEV